MRRSPKGQVAVQLACCSLLLTSCTMGRGGRTTVETQPRHAHLYELSELHWSDALYYKPAGSVSDLDEYATPLIVQELHPAGRIGRLTVDDDGQPVVEAEPPTVYHERSTCILHGLDYEQMVFLWFYETPVESASSVSLPVQGVRITYDTDGLPVLWEAMASDQRVRIIFASKRLEELAVRQHGGPLPGRRHALEKALWEAADTVVARVLDDGPLPMGPILHLLRDGNIGTISCRCMPSQVDNFVETLPYDLVPFQDLADQGLGGLEWVTDGQGKAVRLAFTPAEAENAPPLSALLRLPSDI